MRAVNLDIPVTNTGSRDGAEVVQVYVRNPQDPDGPLMQLRAFQRIELKAGEKGNVHLHLDKKTFEWFNEATNTVVTKSGQYELLYGNSSAPEALKKISINVIN